MLYKENIVINHHYKYITKEISRLKYWLGSYNHYAPRHIKLVPGDTELLEQIKTKSESQLRLLKCAKRRAEKATDENQWEIALELERSQQEYIKNTLILNALANTAMENLDKSISKERKENE